MSAYLFLWNPEKDPESFRDYEAVCAAAEAGRAYETRWICRSTQPQPGDEAIVQRTGKRHNGVFARGTIIRARFTHRGTQVVGLRLTAFLPLGAELPRPAIVGKAKYSGNWQPMASGNAVPSPLLRSIDELWKQVATSSIHTESAESDAGADELFGIEGERYVGLVTHRKRERELRDRKVAEALERHGRLRCEVPRCGFDFAAIYGPLGVGYAQVHHRQPLAASLDRTVTRLSDLAIVCANCHAMIHRGGECREIASLIPK